MHVLIVDDEMPGRQAIKDLLRNESDMHIIGEAGDGHEAVRQITEQKPDLVFLDIQMPGLDGFGVVRQIGIERMPMTVFVTAYSMHALNAFDVHAMDYVLKPIHPERFAACLKRIRQLKIPNVPAMVGAMTMVQQKYPSQILIRSTGKMDVIKTDDIRWVEAQGDYVQIHTRSQKQLMRSTISGFETLLDPSVFQRIHRSVIVRVSLIKELQPMFNGDYKIKLDDGTSLSLSRTYHEKVLHCLNG